MSNEYKVLRGGSFNLNRVYARAAARLDFLPLCGNYGFGARLFVAAPIRL